jgi:acetylornithine deacetylase/succinyl-diaminopimelate desuccinylase-like protein
LHFLLSYLAKLSGDSNRSKIKVLFKNTNSIMTDMTNFQSLFAEYLAFKSISTDPAYKNDIQKTVDWLSNLLESNGFKVSTIQGPNTNPVVIAEYHQSDDLQTVLVYGHYDVQPADKEDGWTEEPFTLSVRNGRMYARGVVDNKGQNLIHIMSVIELIKEDKLKYNVKFMIEGNEETGNEDMTQLVKDNTELLKSDVIIISDGEIVESIPTIEASLRGGFSARVVLTGPSNDLHSGLFGGAVPNPALYAARFVGTLKNLDGEVQIPGFYNGVEDITDDQRTNLERMPADSVAQAVAGVKGLTMEPGVSFYAQVGLRPTIEISGLNSGYTGVGYKNIVPSKAEFRVNFRLIPGQDGEKIYTSFKKYMNDNIPDFLHCEIEHTGIYKPVRLDVNTPEAMKVRSLLKDAYGVEPLIKYVGGGIPIVEDFQSILGIDSLLISFGNEDCAMHGADENFRIDLLENALKFSRSFFSK